MIVLHFLLHHYIVCTIIVLVSFMIAAGSAMLEGYFDAKERITTAPREPMMWCNKHGAYRMKHCLPLFPELNGSAQNANVCPSCYYQTVFTDVNAKL